VKPRLERLATTGSFVGDVRGRGAMFAIELVRAGTRDPAPELARAISEACQRHGVLTLVCGSFGNVIRLLPPLVISDELLDDALTVLEQAVLEHR
jgi:4-aminobutyrate aminotransferase/(S)-3-amino-2-methylpropionate transaminase